MSSLLHCVKIFMCFVFYLKPKDLPFATLKCILYLLCFEIIGILSVGLLKYGYGYHYPPFFEGKVGIMCYC